MSPAFLAALKLSMGFVYALLNSVLHLCELLTEGSHASHAFKRLETPEKCRDGLTEEKREHQREQRP